MLFVSLDNMQKMALRFSCLRRPRTLSDKIFNCDMNLHTTIKAQVILKKTIVTRNTKQHYTTEDKEQKHSNT